MTREEMDVRLMTLSYSPLLPHYDPALIAECLIDEVLTQKMEIPRDTEMLMISIAAVLKREHSRSIAADLQTAQVLNKARRRLGHG